MVCFYDEKMIKMFHALFVPFIRLFQHGLLDIQLVMNYFLKVLFLFS